MENLSTRPQEEYTWKALSRIKKARILFVRTGRELQRCRSAPLAPVLRFSDTRLFTDESSFEIQEDWIQQNDLIMIEPRYSHKLPFYGRSSIFGPRTGPISPGSGSTTLWTSILHETRNLGAIFAAVSEQPVPLLRKWGTSGS